MTVDFVDLENYRSRVRGVPCPCHQCQADAGKKCSKLLDEVRRLEGTYVVSEEVEYVHDDRSAAYEAFQDNLNDVWAEDEDSAACCKNGGCTNCG
jgi:hypothetical protein